MGIFFSEPCQTRGTCPATDLKFQLPSSFSLAQVYSKFLHPVLSEIPFRAIGLWYSMSSQQLMCHLSQVFCRDLPVLTRCTSLPDCMCSQTESVWLCVKSAANRWQFGFGCFNPVSLISSIPNSSAFCETCLEMSF